MQLRKKSSLKHMKRIVLFISIVLLGLSCKSSKYNTPYNQFRATQKSFTSKDGVMRYVDEGKGPVMLLLHGVPTSSWLYRKMINQLVAKGYRVIAPDMLGFGNSDNPKGYEIYNEKNHAKRLLSLMDTLKINQWSQVFHDAGGLWTWEMLRLAPSKISHLIMLNTIVYEKGFQPPVKFKKGVFAKMAMWVYKNGITTNQMLKGLFKVGLKKNNLTKEELAGYKLPLLEGKTRAMYYFFTQTCRSLPDYESVISKLDIPTMVVWGKHDEMLQWTPQQEKLIKTLKIKSKDIYLIDAKHFIQEELPTEVCEHITSFLE